MKNFFKKLSFVLASAMVITSLYAPANAEAASNFVRVKGTKKAVTSKDIFVGGRKVNFDYTIGKKTKGVSGTWTSSDTSVAVVDKKTGVVKAVSNGTAIITFKTKKTKSMKKVVTIKTTVNTFTRAKAVELSTATAEVKLGESLDVTASLISIDKAGSSNSTYNLVASSSDENIATAKVDGTTISISPIATGSATFTVFARHKNGDKYDTPKVELTVTVIANLSAKQSAANKITVMGADLSKEAKDYVVKNDKGVVQNLKSVTADKDGNIVLESSLAQYPEGKYVVIYDKNELPLDIEKSMSKVIKLMPEDKAIGVYASGKYTKAFVRYAIYDQFGTDVTGTSLVDVKVSGSYGAKFHDTDKTKIEFTNDTSVGFQLNVSEVTVNLYDYKNQKERVALDARLVVSEQSKVSEAEFVGLWDENASKFVEGFDENHDLANKAIYAVYTLKDQYGNVLKRTDNTKDEINVLPVGVANITIDYSQADHVKAIEDKTNKKEYVGFRLSTVTGAGLREGEVDLRANIFANSAKNTSNKFNVTHAVKVHDINVYVGTNGLYDGQKNELSFSATDQDGKPVKAYKYLNKVTFSTANFKWEATDVNDENSDAKLIFDAKTTAIGVSGTSDTSSQTYYYISTSDTQQVKQFSLSVNTKRKVVGLSGLQDKVAVGVTKGNTLVLRYNDLKFQDQYGGTVTAKEIVEVLGGDYYVKATFTNSGQNIFDGAGSNANGNSRIVANSINNTHADSKVAELTAKGDKSASETLKITVHNATAATDDNMLGSPLLVDLHSIHLKDVADIKIADVKRQSVADAYANLKANSVATVYDFTPEVTGTYKSNQIIKLVVAKDYTIVGGVTSAGKDVNDSTNPTPETLTFVNLPKKADLEAEKKTVMEKTLKIILTTGQILEKKYEVTTDAPAIVKLSITDDSKKVVDLGTVATSAKQTWAEIGVLLTLEDQFGRKDKVKVDDIEPYVVFTKADTEENNALVTISDNATTKASFVVAKKGTGAQPVVKVKAKIVIGSYVFETFVTAQHDGT